VSDSTCLKNVNINPSLSFALNKQSQEESKNDKKAAKSQ